MTHRALSKTEVTNVLKSISYSANLKSGIGWLFTSIELKSSGDVLFRSFKRTKKKWSLTQSALLFGFSLENLFKAYLVASGSYSGNSLPKPLKGHNLLTLRDKVFTDKDYLKGEKELLNMLSEYSIWQGRYPVPLDSGSNFKTAIKEEDIQFYRQLWRTYFSQMPTNLKSELKLIASKFN